VEARAPTPHVARVPGAADPIEAIRARLAATQPPVEDAPMDGQGLFSALMERLPHDVQATLDHEQRLALRRAAGALRWGRHPLDIRLTLPFGRHRYFLVLIGGRDRRRLARRPVDEPDDRPLVGPATLMTAAILVTVYAAMGGLTAFSIVMATTQ